MFSRRRLLRNCLALLCAGVWTAVLGVSADSVIDRVSNLFSGSGAASGSQAAREGPVPRSPEAPEVRDSTVLRRMAVNRLLRVCIWPEYHGITYRHPRDGRLSGIDIDLSAELARELGVQLRYVESSFPGLVTDLEEERCDVAMFAVAISPARQNRLAFTRPYLQSDIYGVTTRGNRTVRQWSDIDRHGVVVAVQPGTMVETVMRSSLRQARLLVVQPPATREAELTSGRADVFMTDYPYSKRLLDNADWARVVAPDKPFHQLSYAYAVRRGDAAWLARMDRFVAAVKRDGRLRSVAERHGMASIVAP